MKPNHLNICLIRQDAPFLKGLTLGDHWSMMPVLCTIPDAICIAAGQMPLHGAN